MDTEPKTVIQLVFGVVLTIVAMMMTGLLHGVAYISTFIVMAIVGVVTLFILDIIDGDVDRPWINSILLGFILVGMIQIVTVGINWVVTNLFRGA